MIAFVAVDLPTWRHTPTSSATAATGSMHWYRCCTTQAGASSRSSFCAAKNDSDALKVFTNTMLGQARRREDDEIGEAALAKRGEPFSLDVLPPELAPSAAFSQREDELLASGPPNPQQTVSPSRRITDGPEPWQRAADVRWSLRRHYRGCHGLRRR